MSDVLEPGQTWKHTDESSGEVWRSSILDVQPTLLPYSNEPIVKHVSTSPDGNTVSHLTAESAHRAHWTEKETESSK